MLSSSVPSLCKVYYLRRSISVLLTHSISLEFFRISDKGSMLYSMFLSLWYSSEHDLTSQRKVELVLSFYHALIQKEDGTNTPLPLLEQVNSCLSNNIFFFQGWASENPFKLHGSIECEKFAREDMFRNSSDRNVDPIQRLGISSSESRSDMLYWCRSIASSTLRILKTE